MKRKVLLAMAAVCLAVSATASAGGTKYVPPAKAKCTISKISFKAGSIIASGSCKVKVKVTMRKRVVTKTKIVAAKWAGTQTDWDAAGFACGSPHRIPDKLIFMGATLPYKVTGQFTLTARNRPSNKAVRYFSHVYGGNFYPCGPQPAVPPDPVKAGLCQWPDAPVPNCGVPVAGKDRCFWSSGVQVNGTTVASGSIACPAYSNGGYCQYASARDPSKPPPTETWLGYTVQLVLLTCSDHLFALVGVKALEFTGPLPQNKSCRLGPKYNVQRFNLSPSLGGTVRVAFALEVYGADGQSLGTEYETAVFDLHGTKDPCTELGLA